MSATELLASIAWLILQGGGYSTRGLASSDDPDFLLTQPCNTEIFCYQASKKELRAIIVVLKSANQSWYPNCY